MELKELIMQGFYEGEMPCREKASVSLRLVEAENEFLGTLNDKQRQQYDKLMLLVAESNSIENDALFDYVWNLAKNIYK